MAIERNCIPKIPNISSDKIVIRDVEAPMPDIAFLVIVGLIYTQVWITHQLAARSCEGLASLATVALMLSNSCRPMYLRNESLGPQDRPISHVTEVIQVGSQCWRAVMEPLNWSCELYIDIRF